MVRQVCKKQEQVLSFVVSPGCFCLSFCFRVLFCFKPEKRVPPFHNPKEFRADDHYLKKVGGEAPKSKRCCGGTASLGPGYHQRHGLVCGAGCSAKVVSKQLLWSVGQGEVVGGKGVWPRPRPRAWHQQWRCGTGGGGLCQRVWKEGRGGWVGGGRGG